MGTRTNPTEYQVLPEPLQHTQLHTTLEYSISILLRNTCKMPTSTQHPLGVGVLQSVAHTAHGELDGWTVVPESLCYLSGCNYIILWSPLLSPQALYPLALPTFTSGSR